MIFDPETSFSPRGEPTPTATHTTGSAPEVPDPEAAPNQAPSESIVGEPFVWASTSGFVSLS